MSVGEEFYGMLMKCFGGPEALFLFILTRNQVHDKIHALIHQKSA